jgi:hypothetical protein
MLAFVARANSPLPYRLILDYRFRLLMFIIGDGRDTSASTTLSSFNWRLGTVHPQGMPLHFTGQMLFDRALRKYCLFVKSHYYSKRGDLYSSDILRLSKKK